MSFFSDLFEGNFSSLGTDLSHAPESLAKHPSELYETLGGAAALATGGLGLGLLGAEGGAGTLGSLGGFLGEGGAGGLGTAVASGADSAGLDALAAGAAPEVAPAVDAASTLGGGSGAWPTGNLFGLDAGITGEGGSTLGAAGGDITGSAGGAGGGGTFFDSSAASAAYGGGSAAPGGGAGGGGGILDSIMHPTLGGLSKAAGIGVSGGLLGYDLLKGNPVDSNQKVLQQQAAQLGAQGQALQSYLTSGTLPPALKAQLDQATKAEKARIVSGYASRGQPTDPNQNSALAQDLNAVDTNAIAAMASTQIQLMNTGIQETGMSSALYETLVKLDTAQNDQLMKAIQGFAAALGGGGGTTLKLA
jgi:hypothetical protein